MLMETVEKKMCVYEKLAHIQNELKAPKGQFNKFGGYNTAVVKIF